MRGMRGQFNIEDRYRHYEVLEAPEYAEGDETYELAFLTQQGFTPERSFVVSSNSDAAAVCIEGIRVSSNLPGFGRGLCSLLSVRRNKKLRTTVSRSSLEVDDEYSRISEICATLLFQHVSHEVDKISEKTGRPLPQASTAGRWISNSLFSSVEEERGKARDFLRKAYKNLPLVVIEKRNVSGNTPLFLRELISHKELEEILEFWTVESRLAYSLSYMSRDLGRELSLNDFLGTLVPDLQNSYINPIVSDSQLFSSEIISSHTVSVAEFSRLNQQTVLRWARKKVGDKDLFHSITEENSIERMVDLMDSMGLSIQSGYRSVRSYDYVKDLVGEARRLIVAPVRGDVEGVFGVNTRMVKLCLGRRACLQKIFHFFKNR